MFGECLCQVGKGGEASAHACSANPTRDVADRSRLETVGGNRGAAGERWELITDREKVFDPGLHELYIRQSDDVHLKRPTCRGGVGDNGRRCEQRGRRCGQRGRRSVARASWYVARRGEWGRAAPHAPTSEEWLNASRTLRRTHQDVTRVRIERPAPRTSRCRAPRGGQGGWWPWGATGEANPPERLPCRRRTRLAGGNHGPSWAIMGGAGAAGLPSEGLAGRGAG